MVSVKKFPHPYKAMIAISNDIDSTTLHGFRHIHSTLKNPVNGFGLDVADSIWCYAANATNGKQLAFFDLKTMHKTPYWKEFVFYTQHGWIDTLHTYGNFSSGMEKNIFFNRELAKNAVAFFKKNNLKFPVWVNHGDDHNTQNIGKQKLARHTWYMQGDDPQSDSYHTDLFEEIGVKYLWDSKGRSNPGYDSIIKPYEMHDGTKVWSFPRYHAVEVDKASYDTYVAANCPFWGKNKDRAVLWYPDALHLQITKKLLDDLSINEQFCIVTQHLGYIAYSNGYFGAKALDTFKLLKEYQDKGIVKLTSAYKLLEYNRVRDHVRYNVLRNNQYTVINITGIDDPVFGLNKNPEVIDLSGLTFSCCNTDKTFIAINNKLIPSEKLVRGIDNNSGHTIGIAWNELPSDDLTHRFAASMGLSEKKQYTAQSKCSGLPPLLQNALKKASKLKSAAPPEDVVPFICIGGMKCGTTTIWNMLRKHPEIQGCVVKEPSYFGHEPIITQSRDNYLSLWPWVEGDANKHIAFEASTHYTKYPARSNVASQMYAVIPDAKLMYIMRNPVKRMESQLAHHISRGEMSIDVFQSGKWKEIKHLFNLSRYALQIDQFMEFYSHEMIHLTCLERIQENHIGELDKIFNFLGISRNITYPAIEIANTRRVTNDADMVKFSDDDVRFVADQLLEDLTRLRDVYNFDISVWDLV